jgi:dUTP pyrophosphatase
VVPGSHSGVEGAIEAGHRRAPTTGAPGPVTVPVRRLDPDLPLPGYAHRGDAGADLVARVDVTLACRGGRALVPTGIALAIPAGFAGFVQPRSGLAWRHGVTCLNTPGLIDAGYRDELAVLLVNTDPADDYEVHRGDRIAQLVIQRVAAADFIETEELSGSDRGLGGFGSTGR